MLSINKISNVFSIELGTHKAVQIFLKNCEERKTIFLTPKEEKNEMIYALETIMSYSIMIDYLKTHDNSKFFYTKTPEMQDYITKVNKNKHFQIETNAEFANSIIFYYDELNDKNIYYLTSTLNDPFIKIVPKL